MSTGIAFIGCGYVADLYLETLTNWKGVLDLPGIYDIDTERSAKFSSHYNVAAYPSFDAQLADPPWHIDAAGGRLHHQSPP